VLESDGIHLTALSGYSFIRHLFDSSLSVISYHRLSLDLRLKVDHETSALQDSRISVLEQQFVAFRNQSDLEFARQQELNDWWENQANENFFVVTGLPNPPGKMSGGNLVVAVVVVARSRPSSFQISCTDLWPFWQIVWSALSYLFR